MKSRFNYSVNKDFLNYLRVQAIENGFINLSDFITHLLVVGEVSYTNIISEMTEENREKFSAYVSERKDYFNI